MHRRENAVLAAVDQTLGSVVKKHFVDLLHPGRHEVEERQKVNKEAIDDGGFVINPLQTCIPTNNHICGNRALASTMACKQSCQVQDRTPP